MTDAYDELPYSKFPYPQTHPDRLATVAVLHGLDPPAPRGCRVLELGCGGGGNLVPLAYADPESRCAGVDRAHGAIEEARAMADALGLPNVELHARDLLELAPGELGEFDFVIAHGVYSWAPPAVREALMGAIASHLAPAGIAFVSYNAQPGGAFRRMLGEMGAWHSRGETGGAARAEAARSLYSLLLEHRADESDPYGAVLARELPRLVERSAASLAHDEMGDATEALWLHEVVAHAAEHELAYVGDAQLGELHADRFPAGMEGVLDGLAGDDPVARAQYGDMLLGRKFRQTLLCRSSLSPAPEPTEAVVAHLRFAAPPGPAQASAEGLEARALELLAEAWPHSVAFSDLRERLAAQEGDLAAVLLAAFRAGRAGPRVDPPAYATEPGPRPRASSVARLQAGSGIDLTSLRHDNVRMEEPAARRLLSLLDGTRDRDAILAGLASAPDGMRLTAEELDGNLRQMAALALLHG
jgi:SAM-dependent methyltransferase